MKAVMQQALGALLKERQCYYDNDTTEPAPEHIEEAIVALRQAIAQPAQVPEGYKLVPIEPTKTQTKAAVDAWLDCGSKLILNKAQAAVRASVAAAPEVK